MPTSIYFDPARCVSVMDVPSLMKQTKDAAAMMRVWGGSGSHVVGVRL